MRQGCEANTNKAVSHSSLLHPYYGKNGISNNNLQMLLWLLDCMFLSDQMLTESCQHYHWVISTMD
jgi:hypothetical protein